MPRLDLIRRPQPFIGICLVIAGWALSHQVGSDSVFDGCATRGGGFVVLVSVIGLLAAGAGGLYGLHGWRVAGPSGRGFMGILAFLLALAPGFAILLQLAAGLILPSCAA